MRLIDADKFEVVGGFVPEEYAEMAVAYLAGNQEILEMIDAAPTADAEPVRHGCWLEINPLFKGIYQCSVCSAYATMTNGALADGRKDYYCSNCGAKMDAEGKDDTTAF